MMLSDRERYSREITKCIYLLRMLVILRHIVIRKNDLKKCSNKIF